MGTRKLGLKLSISAISGRPMPGCLGFPSQIVRALLVTFEANNAHVNSILQDSMAGTVRQAIDIASLSAFIEKAVPEIQLPISLKQVPSKHPLLEFHHALTSYTVWLRTVQSHLSTHRSRWQKICASQETPRQASLQDGTPG